MSGNKKAKLIIVRERGDIIDFDERRKSMKATIRRDIEWAKKTPEVNETNDVIITLIYNLHLVEDGLKGQFDIVVFPEELY